MSAHWSRRLQLIFEKSTQSAALNLGAGIRNLATQ